MLLEKEYVNSRKKRSSQLLSLFILSHQLVVTRTVICTADREFVWKANL